MIFSVIVPFLNEKPYIADCLQSLMSQDFDKNQYEVIFIDNGSTDGSDAIIKTNPNVKLLKEDRKSPYIARNKALSIAQGEIIAFTDADCYIQKDWLNQIYQTIQEKNVGIVLGRRNFKNEKWLLRMLENYENEKIRYLYANCNSDYFIGYTNNMAVKANIFKEIGIFSQLIRAADTEFIHRALLKNPNIKIMYLDKMRIKHLEITSIWKWLKKIYTYGYYNKIIEKKQNYRPLNHKQRMEIYRLCAQRNNYGLTKRIAFFVLLILGNIAYNIGRHKK